VDYHTPVARGREIGAEVQPLFFLNQEALQRSALRLDAGATTNSRLCPGEVLRAGHHTSLPGSPCLLSGSARAYAGEDKVIGIIPEKKKKAFLVEG
jgi:hypothetical protein